MAVKVRGIYENGVVYLTDPLPEQVAKNTPQEVEVVFEPISEEEAAVLAEIDAINAKIEALGDPEDDTPEEREKRVALVMKALQIGPPISPDVEKSLWESTKRPMSMFVLDEERVQ